MTLRRIPSNYLKKCTQNIPRICSRTEFELESPNNKRFYGTHFFYEIPDRYRNAFYLANASFFDDVCWFLHKAYEVAFPKLVEELLKSDKSLEEKTAAAKVGKLIELYDQCNYLLDVRFPIKRENGEYELIRGFRSHHGLFSGLYPCMGGLRMDANVTRDQMKALAAQTTYKHGCMGIGLAGAHGGIKVHPLAYTERERANIIKQYVKELYKKGFCGGQSDIIEPDINTGALEMSWIAAAYAEMTGKTNTVCNTAAVGKPSMIDGLPHFDKTGSQAAYFAVDYFLNEKSVMKQLEMTPGIKNKTFIIEGLGKIGSNLAQYMENAGAMCVGVKEYDGYIYDTSGINIKDLLTYKEKYGSITYFAGIKPYQGPEIYKEVCDILIFAARQKCLMSFSADVVQAKVILEASNGPIPPISHKILMSKNKLIIPDIYACSGASIASYLEYLLNLKRSGVEISRHSRGFYKYIIQLLETKETYGVVSSNTTQKIVDSSMDSQLLTYAIESVMVGTANEIMNAVRKYDLGLDIKTAAYTVALVNIFRSIYSLKRY